MHARWLLSTSVATYGGMLWLVPHATRAQEGVPRYLGPSRGLHQYVVLLRMVYRYTIPWHHALWWSTNRQYVWWSPHYR